MQIVYALTSDGNDVHADMALVSMLSARLTNPRARLRLLADTNSAQALQTAQHRLLEVCDELTAVPTPDGPPLFTNRWVKTQAAEFVNGDCLLLDCDTIVAGDVSVAWPLITDVGLVANHNAPDLEHQVWSEDLDFLRQMGWVTDFPFYANGGAIFFRPTPGVRDFFRRWHQLWQEGATASNRLRDQPSLNTALHEGRLRVTELPPSFNCQTGSVFARAGDATVIFHFYGSQVELSRGPYAHLVSLAGRESMVSLGRSIHAAIDRRIFDPATPARRGIRFKASVEASLEPARGKSIALLLTTEYEGIYRNGGIGTYYLELSRQLHQRGWFTILLSLSHLPVPDEPLTLPGLDRIFHASQLEEFLELNHANSQLLAGAAGSYFDNFGIRALLFIQAMACMFPGQRVYAEFHEMCGLGYHAAKAKESGWLDPEVVVAVTMHSGHEWVYEANDALLSQENAHFFAAATREEESFRSAQVAMFPSDSLHEIVESYGWRTAHAAKLPYIIPMTPRSAEAP